MTEIIVAAAIRFGELIISAPPPARHHTLLHGMFDLLGSPKLVPFDQGFVTSTGRFVEREKGLQIAIAAKQTDKGKYRSDELFSEDLW
jgi:hypothetical protein